jgi:phosphohistidine phosphatase
MKRLILVRHAKSSWGNPAMDDFDRPLNERGLRDIPAAAERLAQFIDSEPVQMECSPAERAKATSLALAAALNFNDQDINWNPDIYLCAPMTWLELIRKWDNAVATGISVGHNPGITTLVSRLSLRQLDNMPTASMAAIEFELESWQDIDWGLGKLVWFDYPKLHGI